MSDDKLLNIPVSLAGRTYPVLVTEQEAKNLAFINEQLNKEFLDLKSRYMNKLNNQDILAMLLLTYAKDLHEERESKNLAPVEKRIQSIENILELALNK
jgi:hypothetical protein